MTIGSLGLDLELAHADPEVNAYTSSHGTALQSDHRDKNILGPLGYLRISGFHEFSVVFLCFP